jgi:hypothetical protein
MEPTSYMYFAHTSLKVPLYNSNEYEVDLENGMCLKISPHHERLLVSYLNYPKDMEFAKRNIHQWLNNSFKDFPPYLQDIFISNFIKDHPIQKSEQLKVPLQAIDGLFSFYLPTTGEIITITEEQEKELVEIINLYKNRSKKKVYQWFLNYFFDHGFDIISYQGSIRNITVEFIAEKGYIVESDVNWDRFFEYTGLIWKILIAIIGGGFFIYLILSIISFLLK